MIHPIRAAGWALHEDGRRLAEAFGSTAETWLGMQRAYGLWQVRSGAGELTVEQFAG